MNSRLKELLAMVLIGDGALSLVQPRRHTEIWNCGPRVYKDAARKLREHPGAARALGLGLLCAGFLLGRNAARV